MQKKYLRCYEGEQEYEDFVQREDLSEEIKLERLTEDHNVANKYVQLGIITKEEARNHPTQSVLSNSIRMMDESQEGSR